MKKTVLITGASSGIGKVTAEYYSKKGWRVAATSRAIEPNDFSEYPSITCYSLDVTDDKQIKGVFKQVESELGHIDVVINNAGYGLDGAFEAFDDEQIKRQFETNVFGLMKVTRAAIQVMRPRKSGHIIQVASMGGRLTFPLYSVYHASKWAVEGFSESLQFELRQFNIKLKIVEPGAINTGFYKENRVFSRPKSALGYDDFIDKVETISLNAGRSGRPPETVAKAIYKASLSSSSRLRYPVGYPAPLLLLTRKLLPERIFLFLIRLNYRID